MAEAGIRVRLSFHALNKTWLVLAKQVFERSSGNDGGDFLVSGEANQFQDDRPRALWMVMHQIIIQLAGRPRAGVSRPIRFQL